MANRTVSVYLKAKFGEYLAASAAAEKKTKDVRAEVDKLNQSGSAFTKAGLLMGLASVPSLAAPAMAALGAVPALALSGAAALGVMKVATNGVGDAMKAVADGDADAFDKAMSGLSDEAREFVLAYEKVKPVLDDLGSRTQDAFFHELNGSLETLTRAHLPTLLQQMPKVAGSIGKTGAEFTAWASAPSVVRQVNRQFSLGADLVGDFGGLLRNGTALLLDMADAGGQFARELVQGTSRGVDGFRRWLETARAQGQINDLFDNAKRILAAVSEVAAEAGDTLFDVVANPALVNGAETFLDILGLLLQVVHGVLGVFELLPAGMQGFVATSLAVGAAVLILTGRIMALKASLESAKVSALTTGATLKSVGAFMTGPWGIALTAATVAVTLFAAGNAEAESKAAELRDTLDEQTGAFTDSTRAMVVNRLEAEGVLRAAKNMGLDLKLVTDAAMGNADAMWTLNNQLNAMDGLHNVEKIQDGVGGMNDALTEAQAQAARFRASTGLTGDAVDTTTGAFTRQERAVKELSATLRAQTDPMFAMIKAQKDAASAQAEYTKAVKEHGPKSQEAIAANLKLAENAVILKDAVAGAAGAFDGQLSPELEAAMRAAGATDKQIATLKKSLQEAKVAADKFEGVYGAEVNVKQASLDAALAKIKRLRELSQKMGFSINAYDPEGLVRNRHGGIYQHAAVGVLRDAGIHSAKSPARYAYAEPATGGELFAPRFGDMNRTKALVGHAVENWWGGWENFAPGGHGRGGSMSVSTTHTVIHEHHHTLTLNGTSVLSGLRDEVDLRGGNVQKVVGSRR